MTGWITDTKNGFDDLEVYMECGYVRVQLAEIISKWRIAFLT